MNIEKNKGLYSVMVQAVAKTSPARVKELIEVIEKYNGSPAILNDFLTNMGTKNPWEAASKARLKQAIFRTPKEIKDRMYSGKEPIHGFSRSGHRLKDQLFVIAHMYDPTVTLNYGSQAIIKIMEAFGTYEQKAPFTPEGQTRIASKKRQQAHETLRNIKPTIERLLSPTESMHLYSVLELNGIIEKQLRMLDKLVHGNPSLVDMASNTYLLASQKGGAFSTFFKRNMDKLPIEIRDIYTTVTNPHIELDNAEKDRMIGSLIAYMAMKMPVNTQSILGGYKKDLEFILKPENPHIRTRYGEPNLAKINEIMAKPEITLLQATEVFMIYPFEKLRVELNKGYFAGKIKDDFESVTADLKELFIKENKWMEDSLSSIPLARLGKSISSTALGREDYEAIRNSLMLQTIAQYDDGFYKSQDIANFRALVDTVVIAKRKLDFMKIRFENNSVQTTPDDIEKTIAKWKGEMLRGNQHDTAENFDAKYGLTLDEFTKRADTIRNNFWISHQREIKEEARVGLYLNAAARQKELETLSKKAKELIPYLEIKKDYDEAKSFLDSSMILRSRQSLPLPWMDEKASPDRVYFKPKYQIRQKITAVLKAKEIVSGIEEQYSKEIKRFFEWRQTLQTSTVYRGEVQGSIFVSAGNVNYIELPTREISDIVIIDPKKLEGVMNDFGEKYIRADSLPKDWLEKAKLLTSYQAAPALRKKNLRPSDKMSWKNLQSIKPTDYVAKEFVSKIEELHSALYQKR